MEWRRSFASEFEYERSGNYTKLIDLFIYWSIFLAARFAYVPTVRLLTYSSGDYYKRTTITDSGNRRTLNMSNTSINNRNTKLSFVVFKLQGVSLREKKNPNTIRSLCEERYVCCVSLVVWQKKGILKEVESKK